jgi:putative MATE family efflux protein
MKTEKDNLLLTHGNPAKRIVLFALPILGIEILHIFYTMVDAFIVGRWLGINGLAAVGSPYNLITFVYGFCFGITGGFTVITAQRAGAGNEQGIRRSVAAGFILSLLTSVIFMIVLFPLIRPILSLMQTPEEILNDSSGYVLVTFCGLIPLYFCIWLSGVIRAGGNSVLPLICSVAGTVIKIPLVILFVVFFSLGVRGAALATVLADIIAALLAFRYLIRYFPTFIPQRQDWRITKSEIGEHLSLGIVMALQRSIVEIGNILVQTAINKLGTVAIAAVSAAQRVRGLNMMPVFAVAGAMTTYAAQNYGAGRMDRVYKGLFQGCLISLGLGVFMAILNQFTGKPIVSLFLTNSSEAVAMATQFILITGYTVFLLGIMLVFRSTLQGLGKKSAPILCSIMETVMSIFAAFVLIPYLGFLGVCLVNPLSWLASGIPLYIAFAVLRKKLKQSEM